MTATPKNQDSLVTPTRIISSDSELQMRRKIAEAVRIESRTMGLGRVRIRFLKREKFDWIREAIESGVAIASFAFVLIAFQKFVPSTSQLIESKISAVATTFMAWLKIF
jgi:hypothetical protein